MRDSDLGYIRLGVGRSPQKEPLSRILTGYGLA